MLRSPLNQSQLSRSCYGRTLRFQREQAIEITAKNAVPHPLIYAVEIERAYLTIVDLPVPSAREKRRISAEKKPVGPRHLQGLAEDVRQRQGGVVRHPPVG